MHDAETRRAHRWPRVAHGCARSIMSRTNAMSNQRVLAAMGFTAYRRIQGAGWSPEEVEALEDLLDAALATPNAARDARVAETFERTPTMDRSMAEALRRSGLSPVDVFAIARTSEAGKIRLVPGIHVVTGAMRTWTDEPPADTTLQTQCWLEKVSLDLTPGTTLEAAQGVTIHTDAVLPETILEALTGRPVEAVVRHPATDGLPLRVTGATRMSAGTRIELGGIDPVAIAG